MHPGWSDQLLAIQQGFLLSLSGVKREGGRDRIRFTYLCFLGATGNFAWEIPCYCKNKALVILPPHPHPSFPHVLHLWLFGFCYRRFSFLEVQETFRSSQRSAGLACPWRFPGPECTCTSECYKLDSLTHGSLSPLSPPPLFLGLTMTTLVWLRNSGFVQNALRNKTI